MLTTLFYYSHYAPYFISNGSQRSAALPRKPMITEKSTPEQRKTQTFFLNKSLKNEIVKYARDISSSVSGVKEGARQLVSDMERFNKNAEEEGLDTAKKWISDDLKSFTEAFEQAELFMETQNQSRGLRDFIDGVKYILYTNKEGIGEIGMRTDGEKIAFLPEALSRMNGRQVNVAIGRSISVFDEIYNRSTDLLTSPMTEHMNFKGFQYHYNYKMGNFVTDSFNMIESGMVMDMVI